MRVRIYLWVPVLFSLALVATVLYFDQLPPLTKITEQDGVSIESVIEKCVKDDTRNNTTRLNRNNKRRDIFPSKDVLVRTVYFDSRPRKGHQNSSVFLVIVRKNIVDDKLITGCQVGKEKARDFYIQLIGETPLWRANPDKKMIDHEEVMVHCYDLPVLDGQEALLYYMVNKNSIKESVVRSERPLMLPKPRMKPVSAEGLKYNMSVLACTKIYNTPTWLKEWLTYQLAIGIDHVHLNAEETFFRSISRNLTSYMEGLIDDGFLSVDFWVSWMNSGKEVNHHNQGLMFEDCIYQFRGTYDYVYILDTDDFFVPRVPGEKKVQYYIDKMYGRKNVGTCKICWIEFYPDHFGMNKSISMLDGNITNRLLSFSHTIKNNWKSVHRIEAIVDCATHYAPDIIGGYQRVMYPKEIAYVAHVRKNLMPNVKLLKKGLP